MRRIGAGVGAAIAIAVTMSSEVVAAAKPVRHAVAPQDLPAWVRSAAAAAALADDSPAVVMYDELRVEPLVAGGVRKTVRVAVRARTARILDDVGSWFLPISSDDRERRAKSWTISPNGEASTNDPLQDVHDVPYSKSAAGFDDSRLLVVDAPNPVAGALVAYELSVIEALDVGGAGYDFAHPTYPTMRSRFVAEFPTGWHFGFATESVAGNACATSDRSLTCEAAAVAPSRRDGEGPVVATIPGIRVHWWNDDGTRGFESWDAVARWYAALTDPVLGDSADLGALAREVAPRSAEELEAAIERAFSVAARDVRYVSIQLGIGGWRPHPPEETQRKGYGDCKDKAFLLRAIFAAWGRPSYVVLVRTRGSGRLAEAVPDAAQFDHAIAAVALPEGVASDAWSVLEVDGIGRLLLLDATASESRPWDLPAGDQGATALVVLGDGGRLVRLPVQPPSASRIVREMGVRVDERGVLLEGALTEVFSGGDAARARADVRSQGEPERRRGQDAWIQRTFPGARLDTFVQEGIDHADANVVERSAVTGGWFGKRAAHMLLVAPGRSAIGLFPGPPPDVVGVPMRTGVPREREVVATVHVPEGWVPESLPDAIEVAEGDVEGSASWGFADGVLTYVRTARMNVDEVPAERYGAFRDAVLRLERADSTSIVFVKGK